MAKQLLQLNDLNQRRRDLGMSYAALAKRSGVSLPTVYRILSGGHEAASWTNVVAIADALGVCAGFAPRVKADRLRYEQARQKAKRLVRMVQGTSGLEGQAVDADAIRSLEAQTVHELLAGSRQRLWGE
jgi:transcriptional regulator with XRE-family HTH domain